ncbi:MAG: transporter substrate-binding domain-containing protein, partial [Eubacteriales bacterium]|nr:transporter substrate-binding domain-containing protein [Eubacteriales bacterium]
GFNIDLIKAVANAAGYDLEIHLDEWSKVREALEAGELDLISGMVFSEEREEIYSFSLKHTVNIGDVFSLRENKISNIEDLKGKTIVVQRADIVAEYMAERAEELDLRLIEVTSAKEAIQAVSEGEYDYTALMKLPGLYAIKEYSYLNVFENNLSLVSNDYGMAVLKGNEDLLMELNSGLQIIKTTGEYDEIYDKWINIYEEVKVSDFINRFWWIPLLVLLAIIILLGISVTLRYLVNKKTLELEDANINLKVSAEEIEANLEELTAIEEELRTNYDQLRVSEEKRRRIIESLPDLVFTFSKDGRIIEVHNSEGKDLLLPKEQFLGKHILEVMPEHIAVKALENLEKVFAESKMESFEYDIELMGNVKSYEIRMVKSDDTESLGIVRDITSDKKYQENMEYLSHHDYLTGLFNRHYFEMKLSELDTLENLPLCLIMADVNGLKLVNDSFGHKAGDELLIKVGDVLKKACTSGEHIFRIGGDEFIILFSIKEPGEAEILIEKIKELAKTEKIKAIELSISFGWALKEKIEEDIHEVFKDAENQMYKRKLFESPSIRGKTINAIINTLYEKNQREEEHSRRVSELAFEFAQVLGMTEQEVQEIKTMGLLHDIGKIAVNEGILNKEGRLTAEEYDEIKLHPEIGYRILSSVNDMSDMADYVLCHHERWDGKGYPRGISGKDIPLQSRIIAIVDAYDAMISYRTYRTSRTVDEAVAELRKYAGTQFDPELVEIFIKIVLKKE